jgi:glycolate oxidase FAD binding subunit
MTESLTRPRPLRPQLGSCERPTSVAEVSELLASTTGSVLVRGAGTSLGWAGTVHEPDLVLETTGLTGLLTHNPADMTASVRAGTPLAALQEALAADGQWLALDPPAAGRGATVGGLLATGDAGPSRLRYGGLRDLVIGVTLVLADGTVARSGGHVIKNVAGYDLAKLVHGSLGALAVVTEVVVRLHPRPAASLTLTGTADAGQATAAALALMASQLEPSAVEWVSDGAAGQLHVRTDGTAATVEAAGRGLVELLGRTGVLLGPLDPGAAAATWQAHADAVLGHDDETVLRVAGLPSELAAVAAEARTSADRHGLGCVVVSSAALGTHTVRLRGPDAAAHAATLTAVREHALSRGSSVLLRRHSAELDLLVDVLGPPPSTAPLLRRVMAQFDPAGRLAPGRFSPWC